jgi:hypothetical protein
LGVLRAVALLSVIALLARLAAVMFGLGALLVALGRTRTPAVASARDPLRRLPPLRWQLVT